jgi:hypothetical protein
LMECAEKDPDLIIRSSAAVLFAALHDCCPEQMKAFFSPEKMAPILKRAVEVAKARSTPAASFSIYAECFSLADQIRTNWR